MGNNQMVMYAFAANMAYNLLTDNSDDSWMKRLGRATLSSIPMTLSIDTRGIVNYAADRFNIDNVQQPPTTMHSIQLVLEGSTEALHKYIEENNMAAYYSKEESLYKNIK